MAADSSSLIAYWEGGAGLDVEAVDRAFGDRTLQMVPPVLTELFSDPQLSELVRAQILVLPVLPVLEGFWERAGRLRAGLIARGRKARLADSLIAQVCLDHDVALIARGDDFLPFAKHAGLKLLR